MHLSVLVDMIDSAFEDRVLLVDDDRALNGPALAGAARRGAATIGDHRCVVYAGENHPLLPVLVLASAVAGIPFVPLNYRLENGQLQRLVRAQPSPFVVGDRPTLDRLTGVSGTTLTSWMARSDEAPVEGARSDEDGDVAVVLYTSGTTSDPKAVLLRHRNLMAYLLSTVEFGSAMPDEAALVSVPPYHVAGVANMLSNLFAGRRIVYLRSFDPVAWLDTVRSQRVTSAMVVPTMLARIVDSLAGADAGTPTLRSISYGGSRIASSVVARAVRSFEGVGFVNAYGLTETSSTIAVLGPEDHRAALLDADPVAIERLGSVGRVVPGIEVEVRDDNGCAVIAGEPGTVFVRGPQVSGEYASGSVCDEAGWFCTRDLGRIDADGYLFIEGRADDTIIRGGENIAPAEIEDVLANHPAVADACVIGVDDPEWGQRIVAAVVLRHAAAAEPEDLRAHVRDALRGSKTPERIVFVEELPRTDTGKVSRRLVAAQIGDGS